MSIETPKLIEKNFTRSINLRVKIIEAKESRYVKNGELKVQDFIIEDKNKHVIGLTLWGNSGDGIVNDDIIELTNAYTNEFRGEVSLTGGRNGKVTITN